MLGKKLSIYYDFFVSDLLQEIFLPSMIPSIPYEHMVSTKNLENISTTHFIQIKATISLILSRT